MLVVPKTTVPKAKFPFIDIHTHQRDTTKLDSLLKDMDTLNMRIMLSSPVNGSFGERTKKFLDAIKASSASPSLVRLAADRFGRTPSASDVSEDASMPAPQPAAA